MTLKHSLPLFMFLLLHLQVTLKYALCQANNREAHVPMYFLM